MAVTPTPTKPWSVAVFEEQRVHLTHFVRNKILPLLEDHEECRRIVIRAPVKSGKREICEYIAMRDECARPTRLHAFLSAWHRIADAEQRDELAMQNMTIFSIRNKHTAEAFHAWIKNMNAAHKSIIIHLDECDHGSGDTHILSTVWPVIRDSTNIISILYSATPEEVLFSSEVDDKAYQSLLNDMITGGVGVEYTPPPGYCGPARFLDANLVHTAIPFFYRVGGVGGEVCLLSPQGKQIVRDMYACIASTPSRNVLVLRLSYLDGGGGKDDKALYQFLRNIHSFPELKDFLIVVDKADNKHIKSAQLTTEKIQWSNPTYWRRQVIGVPILLVIDQTCSRSTEWACHNRVFAMHDFRNSAQYNTLSQAQERVNHYEQRYGGFQPIQVYGHMRTFELSAGRIGHETFLETEWILKKIDIRISPVPMWVVKHTSGSLHPLCPGTGLTHLDAIRLLQSTGCANDPSLSLRVTGGMRSIPITTSQWYPATKETWPVVWDAICANPITRPVDCTRKQNPFDAAEKHRSTDGSWMGYRRGWSHFDYEADIKPKSGWGANIGKSRSIICYKDHVLGVAIVCCIGTQRINSLRAYNSMYK